jgi:hypothetical protein
MRTIRALKDEALIHEALMDVSLMIEALMIQTLNILPNLSENADLARLLHR